MTCQHTDLRVRYSKILGRRWRRVFCATCWHQLSVRRMAVPA